MSAPLKEVEDYYRQVRITNIKYTRARIAEARKWLNSPRVSNPKTIARWQEQLEREERNLVRYITEALKQ